MIGVTEHSGQDPDGASVADLSLASITREIRAFWDEDAAGYDASPSHYPQRPHEQAAWAAALRRLLPEPPASVLDAGAGTGFLSLLLAGQGYAVTPPAGPFDAVIERHLLWTLPDPGAALAAWRAAAPVGRLVLVESSWGSASASAAETIRAAGRKLARQIRGAEPGHHGHYSDRVQGALPHGDGLSAGEAVALVQSSPWGPARLERLRDIEWAVLDGRGLLDQLLGTSPRWAVVAGS